MLKCFALSFSNKFILQFCALICIEPLIAKLVERRTVDGFKLQTSLGRWFKPARGIIFRFVIFLILKPILKGVAGEVILFHFGWVGFLVGGCVSAVIDVNNLISVIQKESYSTESFLTSPFMQTGASGVLVFIAQMNMKRPILTVLILLIQ